MAAEGAPPTPYAHTKERIERLLDALRCTVVGARLTKQVSVPKKSGKGKTSAHVPSDTFSIGLFPGGRVWGLSIAEATGYVERANEGMTAVLSKYRHQVVSRMKRVAEQPPSVDSIKSLSELAEAVHAFDSFVLMVNKGPNETGTIYSEGISVQIVGDDKIMNELVSSLNHVLDTCLAPIVKQLHAYLMQAIETL
jgi:hypothetical protein